VTIGKGDWLVCGFWVSLEVVEVVEVRCCGGGQRRADRWALVGVTLVQTAIEDDGDWEEVRL